jgi:hypothetical protein
MRKKLLFNFQGFIYFSFLSSKGIFRKHNLLSLHICEQHIFLTSQDFLPSPWKHGKVLKNFVSMAKPILVDDLMALCLLGRNKTENISERGKRKESD